MFTIKFSGKAKDLRKSMLFLEYVVGLEPSDTMQKIAEEINWRKWKWENIEINYETRKTKK